MSHLSLSKKYFVLEREQHARQRASNGKLQPAAIFIKTRDMCVGFIQDDGELCPKGAIRSLRWDISV